MLLGLLLLGLPHWRDSWLESCVDSSTGASAAAAAAAVVENCSLVPLHPLRLLPCEWEGFLLQRVDASWPVLLLDVAAVISHRVPAQLIGPCTLQCHTGTTSAGCMFHACLPSQIASAWHKWTLLKHRLVPSTLGN
jgi:hypothetical protein